MAVNSDIGGYMWLTAWRVGVQFFYICVVLVVFAQLQGRMEIIMVALFGLTYALVRSGRIHTGLAFANFAKELQRELDIIKLKLIPGFEIDWEARKETQVGVDKARYSLLIEAAGASIISLICLFKVLSALSLNG